MKKYLAGLILALTIGSYTFAAVAPFTVPNNTLSLGKTGAADKAVEFNLTKSGASTNPKIKWANSSSKLQFSNDGTNFKDLGSGSGVKNLVIDNQGDAEAAGTTGWACYADAAGTSPVDGTGGSPNITFTQSTSSPLVGTGSFLFTKDAANRQGQGCAYQFSVDTAYKAKVLQIEFEYLVSSGTFAAGSSTTDGDMTVWVYDVTNSTLIQPSTYKVYSNSTSLTAKVVSNFQTSATGSTYRLILHAGSTSASAYALKIDEVKVSPSVYTYGSPITDWVAYTPTLSSFTNTSTTGRWRRVGDSMEINFNIALTGTPVGTLSNISLPSGYAIDTAKTNNTTYDYPSAISIRKAGVGTYGGTIQVSGSGLLMYYTVATGSTSPIATGAITPTTPVTFASSDNISGFITVPIVGWSSNVQMSDAADTRVVAASYTITGTPSASTSAPVDYSVKLFDTHGAVTTGASWKFTAPVSGYYRTSVAASYTSGNPTVAVYKNGSIYGYVTNTAYTTGANVTGSITVQLNAGDYIDLRPNGSLTVSGAASNIMSIERLSGPVAIAASESVNARYTTAAGQTLANAANVTVVWGTKDYDSHNAMNTSTGVYTIPSPGKYSIKGLLTISSATWAATQGVEVYLLKNGSNATTMSTAPVQAAYTGGFTCIYDDEYDFKAGDTLAVAIFQNKGSSGTLLTNAAYNHVAIKKVGN